MPFAIPQDTPQQDTLQADRSVDRPEPSAVKQRTAATAVLAAMVLCAVAVKANVIETPASHQTMTAQNGDVAAPAKIIAPDFCKDQTWPYIDSRCLRRVDNPALPATEPRIVTPPANTTAAAAAPNDATVNNTASSASATAGTTATADQDRGGAQAAPVSGTSPTDARTQVIESVFPNTAPGAASESGVARSDVASYQRTSDGSQHHRHWNRRSNVFGFHF